MARIYDSVDFFWSDEGDYDLDETGDIRTTAYDPLRSVRQGIYNRVKCDKHDWQYQKGIGASLSRFVGQPNTSATGMSIKSAVISALGYHGYIDIGDVNVRVVPISATMVVVRVVVSYIRTRENSISDSINLTFLYDYADNNVYPADGRYEL